MTLLCLVPRPETFSCGPSETAAAQIGWMLCVRSKALRCKNARKNSVARSCCEQIPHYTNVVSEAVRNSPNPAVAAWLREQRTNCFFSVIVIAELEYGIELLNAGRKKERLVKAFQGLLKVGTERILPFDVEVAGRWATLRAKWQHQGKALPALDSMLEATALHWDLTIVTRNTGDFVEAPTLNPWLAPGYPPGH